MSIQNDVHAENLMESRLQSSDGNSERSTPFGVIRQDDGTEGHCLLPSNNLDDNEIIGSALRDSDSNTSEHQNLVHGMCEKVSQSLALNSSKHRVLQIS